MSWELLVLARRNRYDSLLELDGEPAPLGQRTVLVARLRTSLPNVAFTEGLSVIEIFDSIVHLELHGRNDPSVDPSRPERARKRLDPIARFARIAIVEGPAAKRREPADGTPNAGRASARSRARFNLLLRSLADALDGDVFDMQTNERLALRSRSRAARVSQPPPSSPRGPHGPRSRRS